MNALTRRHLALLEKGFAAEVAGAIHGGPGLFQTKSRLADDLVRAGYLVKDSVTLEGRIPATVKGYRLTTSGNAAYCMSEWCAVQTENDE